MRKVALPFATCIVGAFIGAGGYHFVVRNWLADSTAAKPNQNPQELSLPHIPLDHDYQRLRDADRAKTHALFALERVEKYRENAERKKSAKKQPQQLLSATELSDTPSPVPAPTPSRKLREIDASVENSKAKEDFFYIRRSDVEGKEDDAAKAARVTLTDACQWLLKNRKGWVVPRYGGTWYGTRMSLDKTIARVAFGGGSWPDCDVDLEYDDLREKWKVIGVNGGGFPADVPWRDVSALVN